jgi:hypothetical protein
MENITFLGTARSKISTIILVSFLCAALSFTALITLSKNFRSGTDFLIIQNQSDTQDFYSMLKSTEYLGSVLNESVYSDKFVDAVVETNKVDADFLAKSYNISTQDKKGRLDAWANMVSVKRNTAAGIMHIDVINDDKKVATAVSSAIADVLTQKNVLFRGGDEKSVEIRVLSGPIVENNPSIKQMVLTSVAGFVAGLSLMLMWTFVQIEMMAKKKDDKAGEIVVLK